MPAYFYVQGSAANPYKITAEGSGSAFQIFCSCPAGRRGGKFCKHVAALLMGDVTKLVTELSDNPSALAAAAKGSDLTVQAFHHVAKQVPAASSRIELAYNSSLDMRGALDPVAVHIEHHSPHAVKIEKHGLGVFKLLKSGATRKHPFAYILDQRFDQLDELERPRTRPFYAHIRGETTPTFSRLDPAIDSLLKRLSLPPLP